MSSVEEIGLKLKKWIAKNLRWNWYSSWRYWYWEDRWFLKKIVLKKLKHEDLRFLFLLSSHLMNRNTVLLKGVKVTLWNEFPHDAQPKPNPTKSLKWGIWVTWGLSQLRVPTVSIATPHHWSYPHQRSYYLRALVSNHVGMLPGYK